jgi:hypothetical protein
VFIDADKEPLPRYFDWGMRLLRAGGLLLCDNAFFHGAAVDESDQTGNALGVRAFNKLAAGDPRLVATILAGSGWAAGRDEGSRHHMNWWKPLIQAGAVPGSGSKGEEPEAAERAELVEDAELRAHEISAESRVPPAVSFLNGFERWSVRAYDGVIRWSRPIYAAAVRRREGRGGLQAVGFGSGASPSPRSNRMKPDLRQPARPKRRGYRARSTANSSASPRAIWSRSRRSCAARAPHMERELAGRRSNASARRSGSCSTACFPDRPRSRAIPARWESSRAMARNSWKDGASSAR